MTPGLQLPVPVEKKTYWAPTTLLLLTSWDSTELQSGWHWQPEADKPLEQRTDCTDSDSGNSEHLTQCTHLRSKYRIYVSIVRSKSLATIGRGLCVSMAGSPVVLFVDMRSKQRKLEEESL